MNIRRRKQIELVAEKILLENGLADTPGFDVGDLVTNLKIRFVPKSFGQRFSGASMIVDGMERVLSVNTDDTLQRQRFTIAHELGHLELHKDVNLNVSETGESESVLFFRDQASATGQEWREVEANYFAACLLMPKRLLDIELLRLGASQKISDTVVERLAERFNVSERAMIVRLANLGYT